MSRQELIHPRLALILEENEGKELIWFLTSSFSKSEWTFRLFSGPAEFLSGNPETFDLLFLDEKYCSDRVFSFLEEKAPGLAVFILSVNPDLNTSIKNPVSVLNKKMLSNSLQERVPVISLILNQNSVYLFEKRGLRIPLYYRDIFYLEKDRRKVLFHTAHGVFDKSMNLSMIQDQFKRAGFIEVHASFLVNPRYISQAERNLLLVADNWIPVSRAGKKRMLPYRLFGYKKAQS